MKKRIYIVLSVTVLIFILVYAYRIRFADDVSVTFNGIEVADFNTVNVYGLSPLNRKLNLHRTENIFNFSSLGSKPFMNKIVLTLPDSVKNRIYDIELVLGNDTHRVNQSDFEAFFVNSTYDSSTYVLSHSLSKTTFIKKVKTVFSWPKRVRNTIFAVLSMITAVLLFFIFKKNKHLLKCKSRIMTLMKNTINFFYNVFLKKGFLSFCIIVTFVLFLVFALGLYYSLYCGFFAYVFLLLIYFLVILLTFILSLLLRKEAIKSIRLLITSLFFVLLLSEFLLRMFNVNATYLEKNFKCYERIYNRNFTSWYYRHEPNEVIDYTTPEFTYKRQVYEEGFTQALPKKEKTHNEYRILIFGDSFTEGLGVDFDSTWVSQLNKMLSQTYPDKSIYTFNAGIVSSDPVFQYVLLTDIFNVYNFDLVIVCTNESDIFDIIKRGGFERFQPDSTLKFQQKTNWEWLYALSYLTRLVVINGLGYNYNLVNESEMQQRKLEAQKVITESHEKFYRFTQKNKADLLLVFHPSVAEVLYPEYFTLRENIKNLNANYPQLHTVDLHAYYVNDLKININNIFDYYWKIDGHHNAKGYHAFAQGVFNHIIKNRIIENREQ